MGILASERLCVAGIEAQDRVLEMGRVVAVWRRSFMNALIKKHRKEIVGIARRNGFTNVRVFGSMARGDATEKSDVDPLVTLGAKGTGWGIGGLEIEVRELLGRKVDVVTDDAIYHMMRDRIVKEAVSLETMRPNPETCIDGVRVGWFRSGR